MGSSLIHFNDPTYPVCPHLVIELGQQLLETELNIIVVVFLALRNRWGNNAGAHEVHRPRQFLQNVDYLFMGLPNQRDPIHLPKHAK